MTKFVSVPVRPPVSRSHRAARFIASLGLVALAGSTAIIPATAADAAAKPPAPKVTVALVEEKLITEFEEITGRVDSAETVELRARVSGHLDAVHFQAGQQVAKGDVLFTIDPRWHRAQFELARAQAEQARARADVAEREAKRAADLLAASAIASEEAEARRSRAIELRAAVASTEAAFAIARLDLEHTEVRAPIGGRVSRALITAGNLVSGAAGNSTLLTTIVSTGEAFVYADLDEMTVLKFQRLQRENRLVVVNGRVPVDLQLADETEYPRRGFIESTDNRLTSATGSLTVRLVFPNTDGALLPGLYARVRIPISAPQRTLLISDRAVGTDQNQKFVFALGDNNTVVYRTVKLGGAAEGKRIVRDGLRAGDQIVVNGLQRVRPGMTVAPEALATSEPQAATPAKVAQR
jgi:membrane fusion protein, multidrug efflux system